MKRPHAGTSALSAAMDMMPLPITKRHLVDLSSNSGQEHTMKRHRAASAAESRAWNANTDFVWREHRDLVRHAHRAAAIMVKRWACLIAKAQHECHVICQKHEHVITFLTAQCPEQRARGHQLIGTSTKWLGESLDKVRWYKCQAQKWTTTLHILSLREVLLDTTSYRARTLMKFSSYEFSGVPIRIPFVDTPQEHSMTRSGRYVVGLALQCERALLHRLYQRLIDSKSIHGVYQPLVFYRSCLG